MHTLGETKPENEDNQDNNLSLINPLEKEQDTEEEPQNDQCSKGTIANKSLRLPWIVSDFNGITKSVYEAIMVAATRARQIGKRQKAEIDAWNTSIELSEMTPEEEDAEEPGIDHFNHPKPTVKALFELKEQKTKYHYPEDEKKQTS